MFRGCRETLFRAYIAVPHGAAAGRNEVAAIHTQLYGPQTHDVHRGLGLWTIYVTNKQVYDLQKRKKACKICYGPARIYSRLHKSPIS